MKFGKRISIKTKLIIIIMVICILILIIGFGLNIINENNRIKSEQGKVGLLIARLTSEYCIAPLSFNDKKGVEQMLQNLQSLPEIMSASVYDSNNVLFAVYNPSNNLIDHAAKQNKVFVEYHRSHHHIIINEPINYQGKNYGTIFLQMSVDTLSTKIMKSIQLSVLIIICMMILAYVLASRLQNIISLPILRLAGLTKIISETGDYSVRVIKNTDDEIGSLFDGFNNMLQQIESRDNERTKTEKKLKAAKEKAEESDKLKSAFLANMSHEIRTPMNAIIGFTGLLVDQNLKTQEKKHYIDIINSSCQTLLQLIDDILDISRIEAEQLTVSYFQIKLHDMLHELYQTFNHENIKKNFQRVDLILNLPADNIPIKLYTDPLRLKQILSNLLSNAIKFTDNGSIEFGYTIEKGSDIGIDLKKADQARAFIKFYVRDTGIGMSPKAKSIIFERFTKIEDNKTRFYRGAGLGLTISKKLVELLDGKIWVESEQNKGSVFSFILPYTKMNDEDTNEKLSDEETQPETIAWDERNILIAEDDKSNFELLNSILKKTKAKIYWAKNGRRAIEICKSFKIDLALMDIKMPDINGLEATRLLRKDGYKFPIIAQTAYAKTEDRNRCIEAGCDDYIAKPINAMQLLEIIQKNLRHHHNLNS